MRTLALDGCFAKIGRAEEHLKTINDEIRSWMDRHPYAIERQSRANHTHHAIVLRILEQPNLTRWSLIAGDCVHNLRTALDYLVYVIAAHESNTSAPPNERDLMFSIADTATIFQKSEWHIQGLSQPVRAAIERVQPYHRPNPIDPTIPQLLTIIRNFDDRDKHRLLQLAFFQPFQGEFRNCNYAIHPGETIHAEAYLGEVVDGTEIASMTVNRPTPNMQYHYVASLAITVPHEEGPPRTSRSDVVKLLGLLIAEVRDVIKIVSAEVA